MDYNDRNGKPIDINKKAVQHIKKIKEQKEEKSKNQITRK